LPGERAADSLLILPLCWLFHAPLGVQMIITCWSVKGGSGTTVVAASLALIAGRRTTTGALLVDLAGDAPAVLGLSEPTGPGVGDWLDSGHHDPALLRAMEVDAAPSVRLLPMGTCSHAGGAELVAALANDERTVIVDAGVLSPGPAFDLISAAATSLLVLRPCYLALRRASLAPLRPSGVVLITEVGRALGRKDVESVLGVPVVAEVLTDPVVARAVDAGLLAGRLPRGLIRSLSNAA
jgi:MinD-like ATPase involved in chromosome partitioning or flagellar assembly